MALEHDETVRDAPELCVMDAHQVVDYLSGVTRARDVRDRCECTRWSR